MKLEGIKINFGKTAFIPWAESIHFYCKHCGNRIVELRDANIIFREADNDGFQDYSFEHKTCGRACRSKIIFPQWVDLFEFLKGIGSLVD